MKDNEVLQSIDTAYDESKSLLDSALLIKTNGVAGNTRPPTSFMNSSFGMWLYTDGLSLAKYPWFSSMVEKHQLVYEGYSKLFHGAKKSIDISEVFTNFNDLVKSFHNSLDEVKKDFYGDVLEPEPEPEPKPEPEPYSISKKNVEPKEDYSSQTKNIEHVITDTPIADVVGINKYDFVADKGLSKTEVLLEKLQNQKKVSIEPSTPKKIYIQKSESDLSDEHSNIHDELNKEDQNQFELKQELIEQELVQVKDRQKLFTKTINQLDYHSLLKEKESKLVVKEYKEKLSQNSILQKKKASALKDIETKRENTQQEFEDMELASIEFEKTNLQERVKEKETAHQLDQEQKQVEKDHKKVINQQARKKKVVEGLKKRLQQAEEELYSLLADELEISNIQEKVSTKKLKIQHKIEEKLVKQHQDREHYLQLEELKFQSLQRVKKQYFSTQQEILHLEHEQKNISQGMKASEFVRLKEIKQLQEQRDLKQQMLDVLELEYKQKKLDLSKITKMQKKAQLDSTEEMKKLFALEL